MTERFNFNSDNPPSWMNEEEGDKMLRRASQIAEHLITEGYSEEQAFEIALERMRDEESIEGDTLREIDENLLDADLDPAAGARIKNL